MARTRPAHHVLDIYPGHLWLATSTRQWASMVRRLELDEDDNDGLGATVAVLDRETYQYHLVMWVDLETLGDDALAVVETCAHEAAHAATMLLRHVGHEIQHADEPHAYLVGWITRWLIEKIDWPPT